MKKENPDGEELIGKTFQTQLFGEITIDSYDAETKKFKAHTVINGCPADFEFTRYFLESSEHVKNPLEGNEQRNSGD